MLVLACLFTYEETEAHIDYDMKLGFTTYGKLSRGFNQVHWDSQCNR